MLRIYFVRHAQSDKFWRGDRTRTLTKQGLEDSKKVTKAFKNKKIDYIYASPYKRTIDTVKDLANSLEKEIITEEDFRERSVGPWILCLM
jgi:2,3-bisphosphoglycerate-dependent phosphoglycerate mutase